MEQTSGKWVTYCLVLAVLCWLVVESHAQKSVNTRNKNGMEYIDRIFDSMEAEGVDTQQRMLYGYFFFDKDKVKLERLSAELVRQAYMPVALEKNDDGTFALHVEKIETQSRHSLLQRGAELKALTNRFSVETYDGFDVGNADPSRPLVCNESFLRFMTSKKGNDLFDLGLKLYDLDINDKASKVFIECIKQNIKSDISSFKLAGALFELGKLDEALSNLEHAVKLNPKYFDAYFNLGAVYYDSGNYQKSFDNYVIADRLQPNDDKTVYGIAASQFALGKFSEARENCDKVLKLNPKNENAKVLLGMLTNKE